MRGDVFLDILAVVQAPAFSDPPSLFTRLWNIVYPAASPSLSPNH